MPPKKGSKVDLEKRRAKWPVFEPHEKFPSLYKARKQMGLTLDDVCRQLWNRFEVRVDMGQLSRFERAERIPSRTIIRALYLLFEGRLPLEEIMFPGENLRAEALRAYKINSELRKGDGAIGYREELQLAMSMDLRPFIKDKSVPDEIAKAQYKPKDVEYPDWLDKTVWEEFKKMRKRIRRPMTPYAEQLAIKKLATMCPDGHRHVEMINQSVENGWQTFYPLREPSGVPQERPKL